ncbi:MAG TPA: hypothetical protein ENI82_00890, partial [Bacteroidetes bacterium]|nr:hypothetical protein [Bacteroidota bacterium]
MKHIKSFLTISFLTMFILSSCKKDLKELSTYEGANFYYFTESSVEVLESTKEVVSIEVIYGTKDGAAGSVDFELSSTSATEGVDYKVLNATKSLSFDKDAAFKDVIMIEVIDNEVFTDAAAEITIELKNASNGVVGFDGPDKLRST